MEYNRYLRKYEFRIDSNYGSAGSVVYTLIVAMKKIKPLMYGVNAGLLGAHRAETNPNKIARTVAPVGSDFVILSEVKTAISNIHFYILYDNNYKEILIVPRPPFSGFNGAFSSNFQAHPMEYPLYVEGYALGLKFETYDEELNSVLGYKAYTEQNLHLIFEFPTYKTNNNNNVVLMAIPDSATNDNTQIPELTTTTNSVTTNRLDAFLVSLVRCNVFNFTTPDVPYWYEATGSGEIVTLKPLREGPYLTVPSNNTLLAFYLNY